MFDQGAFNFGIIRVEYDGENRLWEVSKSVGLTRAGFVIIDQDTGEIVRALFEK